MYDEDKEELEKVDDREEKKRRRRTQISLNTRMNCLLVRLNYLFMKQWCIYFMLFIVMIKCTELQDYKRLYTKSDELQNI